MKVNDELFELRGYQCRVRKISSSVREPWYCGYVRLKNEPEFNVKNIRVHGGITYEEIESDGLWIGFDCAHYGESILFQNRAYVIVEISSMIDQIEGANK